MCNIRTSAGRSGRGFRTVHTKNEGPRSSFLFSRPGKEQTVKFPSFSLKRRSLAVAVASALAIAAPILDSQAATSTADLSVTANVTASCSISTSTLAFGDYLGASTSPAVDGQGTVT